MHAFVSRKEYAPIRNELEDIIKKAKKSSKRKTKTKPSNSN